MNTKELKDSALDTIVGGSTYMTELKDYLRQSSKGSYFKVHYTKDTGSGFIIGTRCFLANAEGFRNLIILANNSGGKVTLYDTKGRGKVYTDTQLAKMR